VDKINLKKPGAHQPLADVQKMNGKIWYIYAYCTHSWLATCTLITPHVGLLLATQTLLDKKSK